MSPRLRFLVPVLAATLVPVHGCDTGRPSNQRWVTTDNTNVAIDWDRVNEAYRVANGPEDLERRVNEIYPGNEVISIAVADRDARTQEVTGFFDRNRSGAVDEGEKIFTIRREITGDGTGRVQTVGHGAYAGYHSPMLTIASGMLMGAMLSRAFSPGYVPMYTRPYVTSGARLGELNRYRSTFRPASNPGAYRQPGLSGSGRSYGGGPMMRGGGRFGVRRGDRPAPVRLEA